MFKFCVVDFFQTFLLTLFSNRVLVRDPSRDGMKIGRKNPHNRVLQVKLTIVQLKQIYFKVIVHFHNLAKRVCVSRQKKQHNRCLCTRSLSFKRNLSEQISTCSVVRQPAALLHMISPMTGQHKNWNNRKLLAIVVSCIIWWPFPHSGVNGKRLTTHKTVFGYLATVWKFFYPTCLHVHADMD